MQKKDLTGEKFGILTVLNRHGRSNSGNITWKCICECGKEKVTPGSDLRTGRVKSCGCKQFEHILYSTLRHGMAGKNRTSEYKIWQGIFQRCYNEKNPAYHRYGNRGITVCNRWRESFENFLEDMGERPSHLYSLDREDNNGPYSPENCRWATDTEQARNKTYKGYHYHKSKQAWEVSISGKYIGTYKTEEEAKNARKEAEIKYWGKSS